MRRLHGIAIPTSQTDKFTSCPLVFCKAITLHEKTSPLSWNLGAPIHDSNVALVRMVVVAFDKRIWRGASPSVCSPTDIALRQKNRVPAGYPAGLNLFLYIKAALPLCMHIHMHGLLARFIFFIHMLIQVQALQNKTWTRGITLFELKFGKCLRV